MRKLTAGIFSVILGLCAVGSADAAVVSTGYLEQQMGLKQDVLKTTVAGNITINENDEIGAVTGGIGEGLIIKKGEHFAQVIFTKFLTVTEEEKVERIRTGGFGNTNEGGK